MLSIDCSLCKWTLEDDLVLGNDDELIEENTKGEDGGCFEQGTGQ